MSTAKWDKVIVTNGHDIIGRTLVDWYQSEGSRVLVIDETRHFAELAPGVEVIGLQRGLDDVKLGKAVLEGMRRWGAPDLLVNNFSTGFLNKSREKEASDWEWGAQASIRIGLAATVAYATLRQEDGQSGMVLNVGVGIGLIPNGCPMHFSLLGVMRSLTLAKMDHLRIANICLHNLDASRPECQPCADQVLFSPVSGQPEDLREQVCTALARISQRFEGNTEN